MCRDLTFSGFWFLIFRLSFVCLSFGLCLKAQAGVFQCVKENGEIEFRDTPCAMSHEIQKFLPHQYMRSDEHYKDEHHKSNKKIKMLQKQEKKQAQEIQRIAKLENKESRLQQRETKKQEKEFKVAQRQKLRCERINEKIAKLEAELQQGKKLKTYKRLQAELAQAELMKKRYCSIAR